jgi:hypothetical protein
MSPSSRKRKHEDIDVQPIQPRKSQPKDREEARCNPEATFSALPAELRLEIYSYLCGSNLIHVHRHRAQSSGPDRVTDRFTWTPCRSLSIAYPMLCANPKVNAYSYHVLLEADSSQKWSGMCKEEDRCTYNVRRPAEPRGFWALAASNKTIHREMREFFLQQPVVSVHINYLHDWLDYLDRTSPGRTKDLRRLTLISPCVVETSSMTDIWSLCKRLPNLESIGIQGQDRIKNWAGVGDRAESIVQRAQAGRGWYNLARCMQDIDPAITVTFESTIWRKPYTRYNNGGQGQQFVIRHVCNGRANGGLASVWSTDGVKIEVIESGKLARCKESTRWQQWWETEEMRDWT